MAEMIGDYILVVPVATVGLFMAVLAFVSLTEQRN